MNHDTVYVSESLLNELESACKAEFDKPPPTTEAEMAALMDRIDALLVSVNSVRTEPVQTWCMTMDNELTIWFQSGKTQVYFDEMGSA